MKYLIIIDMQNDFVTGPLGTPEAVAIVNRIKKKIEAHPQGKKIIFTRDTHFNRNYLKTLEGKKLPIKHCIYETPGWCIIDVLREAVDNNNDIPVDYNFVRYINKHTFGNVDWNEKQMTDVTEIEIVGVCTDICVISNALILKAIFPNIPIIVDASCCAGSTPEMHNKALDVMKSCQIEVINENI